MGGGGGGDDSSRRKNDFVRIELCSYRGDTSVQDQAPLFCFITHEVLTCWLLRCRLNYTCFINCPQDVLSPITNALAFEIIISYKEKNKWFTRIVLNRVSRAATFEV